MVSFCSYLLHTRWPLLPLLELSHGLLGPTWRPHGGLKRLGEGQQLLIGRIQVNLLPEGLTNLVGSRVVELDTIVFRVVKIHATGDTVGHRAINPQALVLKPMIESPHVIQAFHLEGDLLHIVRFL